MKRPSHETHYQVIKIVQASKRHLLGISYIRSAQFKRIPACYRLSSLVPWSAPSSVYPVDKRPNLNYIFSGMARAFNWHYGMVSQNVSLYAVKPASNSLNVVSLMFGGQKETRSSLDSMFVFIFPL